MTNVNTAALREMLAHCDGKDCKCMAYGQCECACGCDWTPAEVYILRDRLAALEAGMRGLVKMWTGPMYRGMSDDDEIAVLDGCANQVTALLNRPADGGE